MSSGSATNKYSATYLCPYFTLARLFSVSARACLVELRLRPASLLIHHSPGSEAGPPSVPACAHCVCLRLPPAASCPVACAIDGSCSLPLAPSIFSTAPAAPAHPCPPPSVGDRRPFRRLSPFRPLVLSRAGRPVRTGPGLGPAGPVAGRSPRQAHLFSEAGFRRVRPL